MTERNQSLPSGINFSQVLAIIALFLLILFTALYLYLVAVGTHQPFGIFAGHTEQTGQIVSMAIPVVAVILLGLMRIARRFSKIWLYILTIVTFGLALYFSIASQNFREVIAFSWLLSVGWTAGYQVLSWFRIEDASAIVERFVLSLITGLGLISILGLLLAVFQLVSLPVLLIILAILTILLIRQYLRLLKDGITLYLRFARWLKASNSGLNILLLAIMCFTFLFMYIYALAPETAFDAIYYQLPVPRTYIEQGGLVEIPYSFRSYFPKAINMQFMLGLMVGGETSAKLFSTVSVLALVALTFNFGHRILRNTQIGYMAAVLLLTVPLVNAAGAMAYSDIPTALYSITAVYIYFRWRDKHERSLALLLGFMMGTAISAKLQSLFLILPLVILIAMEFLFNRERSWRGFKSNLPGIWANAWRMFFVTLIVGGPWYLITYIWTGNPLFPLYNNIFKSPFWGYENPTFNADMFGTGFALDNFITFPFSLTYNTTMLNEASWGTGLFGLVLMAALLWPMLNKRRERIYWIITTLILAHTFFWSLPIHYARYFVIALPLIVLLAATTYEGIQRQMQSVTWQFSISGLLITIAILAATIMSFNQWFHYVNERIPLTYVLGRENLPTFNRRLYIHMPPYQYLADYPYTPNVLMFGTFDYLHFLPSSRMFAYFDSGRLGARWLQYEKDPAGLAQELDNIGITHLLFATEYMPHVAMIFTNEFLDQYATLEYANGGFTIYRLVPEGAEEKQFENIVQNASFEDVVSEDIASEDIASEEVPSAWETIGSPIYFCDELVYDDSCAVIVDNENYIAQTFPADSEAIYRYSFWSRSDESGAALSLEVNFYTELGDHIFYRQYTHPASGYWSRYVLHLPVQFNASSGQIIIKSNSEAPVYVDLVKIVDMPISPPDTDPRDVPIIPAETWRDLFKCFGVSPVGICDPQLD